MRNAFMNTVIDAFKLREDLFIVSGDAGLGVFDDVKDAYPDRFLNLGVAEQNATSFAAGLALTGFHVYIYNIIPFVLYRCYEQVRNDICYQKLPVTLVGIGSGITYAPQGMTHYSVEDIGIAQTLPNLSIFSPIDPIEAKLAARYSLNAPEPVYVRLAKRGEPDIHHTDDFDITLPRLVQDGSDIAILFHGSIVSEVMPAYAQLTGENIHPRLISVPMLQPLNAGKLDGVLRGIKHVISIEEHFENCGLGNILRRISCESGCAWSLKTMGIRPHYIHDIKDTEHMRKHLGISSSDLVREVKKRSGGKGWANCSKS